MPAYFGAKQLFRNRVGNSPIREIYWGSKQVMGFTAADYNANELIGEKAQGGDYPQITGNGSTLGVMTTNYNPGYAFTRYYCDHIKIVMQYSGGLSVFDIDGNEVVTISGTISFNYLTAKWTITSKCVINGTIVLDTTYEGSDTPANRLTYELYFDTSRRQWTLLFNGGTYRGSVQEWKPTYMRIYCQFWFISAYTGITMVNGVISVQYMNRARGYPNAR